MQDVTNIDNLWAIYNKEKKPVIKEKIILYYLPLVKKIANKLLIGINTGEYEDILSQGVVGLISAVNKYDVGKKVKFETFATYRIRGEIIDYLRKKDWLSRSLRQKCKAYKDIYEKNKDKSDEEIAAIIGISAAELRKVLNYDAVSNILSLDEIFESNKNEAYEYHSYADLNPAENYDNKETKLAIEKYIAGLTERQKLILSLYYVDDLTYKEISKVLDLTESRISQIHSKIIKEMRKYLRLTGESKLI